jgi:adhesin/invasin
MGAGFVLTLATCRDGMEPRVQLAPIAVAPVFPSAAALADFGLTIDGVRFVVVRLPADTVADTTVAVLPDVHEVVVDIRVPVFSSDDSVNVSVICLSGTLPLFAGSRVVPVPTPLPPPEILLDTYVGPAVDSIVIQPRNPFIRLSDSLRFQLLAFNGGAPVSQFFVSWTTSDTALAPISPLGMLHAPGARSSVRVLARTPSGATDSVVAGFTPPATQLLALAGGGQIDTIGQLLGTPLEVQARAADGLGVGGVAVHFRALTGGGSVTDSVVVTDSAGRARTTVTLGGLLGGQTFEATVPGLSGSPVTFGVVALAGPAAQLLAIAGGGQLATVATALLTRPAVQLKDAVGNAVAGASVTFAVSGGGGSLTGASQLTNATGVATVGSWTLGTIAGPNALTASAPGVTPVVFTATGLAGAAASITKVAGDLQSAIVNTVVPIVPQVRIVDQFGNPVSGTGVSAAVASGGGSLLSAAPVSDTSGIASVGGWRVGTLVGANAITVSAPGLGGSPITFTATGLVDVPSQMVAFAGDGQSALVGSAVSINPAARVSDQYGNAVGGIPVTFSIGLGGGSIGTPAAATTDTAGIARSPTWTLGLLAGLNTLSASATGLPTLTFSADGIASLASTISPQAGTGQTGTVGTALATAYAVVVRDAGGLPVIGVPVSWAVASGGGVITPALDTTDASGVSTAVRTLGTGAGTQTATASVGGLTGSPVVFSATALAAAAMQLAKQSLDPQSGTVAAGVAAPVVKVVDQFGNGVAGVIVDFVVTHGGLLGAVKDTSDPQGLATTGSWMLGSLVGTNTVTVTAGALPAVTFSATGLAGAPAQLAFALEPTRGLAGDTMAPVQVAIEDQFGNRVPSAQDFVTLGLLPGSNPVAKLQGTVGAAAVNGVATFASFSIDSAGFGNKLDATAGALTGTSSAFDVGGVINAIPVTRLGPVAAAMNHETKKIYVPGASLVSVLLDDRELLPQLTGFESPFDVAANATTNQVYVSSLAGVAVIDGAVDVVRLVIAVGTGPKGVAVDTAANRIYVAVAADPLQRGPAIVPIDASKDLVDLADVVLLPAPGAGVAFNPNDGFVYVAIPTLQEVVVIDPKPGSARMVGEIRNLGKGPHRVAVDVRANLIYVTNRDDNNVSVINPVASKETARLQVGRTPEGLGVDSDRGVVYVGNSGDGSLSLIDAVKLNVFATLIVGPVPKAAVVDPVSGRVYVPTQQDDLVRVIQP